MPSLTPQSQSTKEHKYPCRNCRKPPEQHMAGGKCPFEASEYAFVAWDGRWLDIDDIADLDGVTQCRRSSLAT